MKRQHLRLFAGAFVIAASLSIPTAISAQVSFEGRVGATLPTGELTDSPGLDQSAGFSFAFDGMYTFRPSLSAYAGVSRQTFNCSDCPTDVATVGFDGGVKFLFTASGAATPWLRGGLMLHRASVDGVDSDWGVGVDAGAGIDWLVGPRIAIVPAVRLNSYGSGPLSLTYFTLDLGLHVHPGS
jgi:hypothetical protein